MTLAGRSTNQFQYTYEKDTVTLYGSVLIGASGAVTSFQGGGILSVVKESTAGQYTVTLSERFRRLLDVKAEVVSGSVSAIAAVQLLAVPATYQATFQDDAKVVLQMVNYAGSAANAASGALLQFRIIVRKTKVGPYDALHS